jgi:hypothetical protein
MGEGRGVYRVLVIKPEGKAPLGRPRRRWEGNLMADLQEVGCRGVNWIELAKDPRTEEAHGHRPWITEQTFPDYTP